MGKPTFVFVCALLAALCTLSFAADSDVCAGKRQACLSQCGNGNTAKFMCDSNGQSVSCSCSSGAQSPGSDSSPFCSQKKSDCEASCSGGKVNFDCQGTAVSCSCTGGSFSSGSMVFTTGTPPSSPAPNSPPSSPTPMATIVASTSSSNSCSQAKSECDAKCWPGFKTEFKCDVADGTASVSCACMPNSAGGLETSFTLFLKAAVSACLLVFFVRLT